MLTLLGNEERGSPLVRFKEFVSKILTVTRDDVQKMEAEIAEEAAKVARPSEASDLEAD